MAKINDNKIDLKLILLSFVFLLIIENHKTVYAYPVVFFQLFCRFPPLLLGGFNKQDEARISALLGIETCTVAIIGLLILSLMAWRASHMLTIDLKGNGYFLTISMVCILIVISTYELMSKD